MLLLEPRTPTVAAGRRCCGPASELRVGEVLPRRASARSSGWGSARAAGDTFDVELLGRRSTRWCCSTRSARCRCLRTSRRRSSDPARYQTVFAASPGRRPRRPPGCISPPSCSLGSPRRRRRGKVELVVGLDTFQPISTTDPLDHRCTPSATTSRSTPIGACRGRTRRGAVGTTAVRALESAAARGELSGRTNLFIHRGFDWQVVDVLMTNFHLPRTTLLMMIDAFVGDRWRRLYDEALAGDYRFLSFGDAMLLDRRRRARSMFRVDLTIDGVDGSARAGHGDDGTRVVHDAAVHAGRHPRRDQVPERCRLRAGRRRRSCSATRTT